MDRSRPLIKRARAYALDAFIALNEREGVGKAFQNSLLYTITLVAFSRVLAQDLFGLEDTNAWVVALSGITYSLFGSSAGAFNFAITSLVAHASFFYILFFANALAGERFAIAILFLLQMKDAYSIFTNLEKHIFETLVAFWMGSESPKITRPAILSAGLFGTLLGVCLFGDWNHNSTFFYFYLILCLFLLDRDVVAIFKGRDNSLYYLFSTLYLIFGYSTILTFLPPNSTDASRLFRIMPLTCLAIINNIDDYGIDFWKDRFDTLTIYILNAHVDEISKFINSLYIFATSIFVESEVRRAMRRSDATSGGGEVISSPREIPPSPGLSSRRTREEDRRAIERPRIARLDELEAAEEEPDSLPSENALREIEREAEIAREAIGNLYRNYRENAGLVQGRYNNNNEHSDDSSDGE